jgi:uncharacterized RDD family membrane protein YckC
VNKLLLLALALLSFVPLARASSVTPHSVVAHASEQEFWVARIERFNNEDYTVIYYRLLGQDDRWQRLCKFDSGIDDIAAQGSLAAVLLRDKSWALIYSDGNVVTAGALPASAKMFALSGAQKTWWAVGLSPGGLPSAQAATRAASSTLPNPLTRPSTHPTSNPSRTPSQPSITASAPALVLFQLVGNTWMPTAELPGPLPDNPRIALSIVEETPYVASFDADSISVHHLEAGRWIDDLTAKNLPQTAAFRLIGETAPPKLWVQQQTGPDLLFTLANANAKPTSLTPLPDVPPKDRDVALFGRSLRIIGHVNDKLIEQRFDVDGTHAQDQPTPLAIPDSQQLLDLQGLHTLVTIVSLTLVLLGWFRQQAATEGAPPSPKDVTIAPVGRRFAAGLIDASPIFLTMLFFLVRHHGLPTSVPQSPQFLFFLAYWSASLFYILYTTFIETLAGRSLGKIMMGLRVVNLQGLPPTQAALFTRNALRIFDISLFFFPVLFIPFSPFRQRSGDLAAGTLVVSDKSPNAETPPSEPDPK